VEGAVLARVCVLDGELVSVRSDRLCMGREGHTAWPMSIAATNGFSFGFHERFGATIGFALVPFVVPSVD